MSAPSNVKVNTTHKVLLPQKTMKPDSEFTYAPSDCRGHKGQKDTFKYTMGMLSVKCIV